MTEATKDLDYYLEHPDEMPTDPAEIEKITNASHPVTGEGEGEADESPEAKAKAEAKTAEEAKAKAEAGEVKPDGVLAKDGKHVIPWDVMEKTRAHNVELEELSAQQAERIKQLEAGGKKPGEADVDLLTDEDLAAVEAEMPALGKVLRSQQAVIQRFHDRESEERLQAAEDEKASQKTIEQEIEEGKAANPKLLEWESNNPVRFGKAAEIDAALRRDPEWQEKPFKERFSEVVSRTQRHFGDPIETPGNKTLSASELQARAAKAVKDAGEVIPGSLSDLPGGTAPGASSEEALANANAADIARTFDSMSNDQILAALARVA